MPQGTHHVSCGFSLFWMREAVQIFTPIYCHGTDLMVYYKNMCGRQLGLLYL